MTSQLKKIFHRSSLFVYLYITCEGLSLAFPFHLVSLYLCQITVLKHENKDISNWNLQTQALHVLQMRKWITAQWTTLSDIEIHANCQVTARWTKSQDCNVMVIMCVCVCTQKPPQACQLQDRYQKCLCGLTQPGSVLVFFHMGIDESWC